MKFLGLNSPEIFLISVIILSILGTKRIEKGWIVFKGFLKFLLNDEEKFSQEKSNLDKPFEVKNAEPEVAEVKEEVIESELKEEEVKNAEPEVAEVKEEVIESELKEVKSKRKKNQKV